MEPEPAVLAAARAGNDEAFAQLLAPYRRELHAHCYRMSGSLHDADDLLQESLLRAWRGLAGFEGRSSLRTWLYKVTTHACLDALEKRSARVLPMDLGPAADPTVPIGPPVEDPIFLEPCPSELYEAAATPSPEARIDQRESVALAFLIALQRLPPKQRAVLLLRDVLGLSATESAELLDLTVAAANSALQRARTALSDVPATERVTPRDPEQAALLARYIDAWEQADPAALIALLREDATLAMPPQREWLLGAAAIGGAIGGMVFARVGPGGLKLLAIEANGLPAVAAYQRDPATGRFAPISIHLLAMRGGTIAAITAFVDPTLFARFGLPATV